MGRIVAAHSSGHGYRRARAVVLAAKSTRRIGASRHISPHGHLPGPLKSV